MMNIVGRRVCMACFCIAVTSTTAAEDNVRPLCVPQPDKSNVTNAPECIQEFFKQYSEEEDSQKLNASYALGVRFQREIAEQFKDIDYARFLLGAMEQADKTMQFSNTELDSILESFLLSKAEQSDKFVRNFAAKSDVVDFKGIYYIDRTGQSEQSEVLCYNPSEKDSSYDYVVEFVRLNFHQKVSNVEKAYTCLHVNEDEVIRGWRTALRKMKEGNEWELLVPAALAYGNDGTSTSDDVDRVEKGEALRFLIRLHKKP